MSKHTFKLDGHGFNKSWVRSFKTLDSFLNSIEAQSQFAQHDEGKRKELLTKVFTECNDSGPKPSTSLDAKAASKAEVKK